MRNKLIRALTVVMAVLIVASPLTAAFPAHAATLEQDWAKNVGTSSLDQVVTMTKTADGGYVVGGYSNADIDADQGQNYMLAKLDAKGNQLWLIHLGGSAGFDAIQQVIETSDGGLAIVGDTAGGMGSGGTITAGGFVLKLDAGGNEQWGVNVGVKSNDHFNAIVQTTDGGYAVAGSTNGDLDNGVIGSYDGAIVKLDTNGNKLWAKNVGTTSQESLSSLIQTADGGFIAAGTVLDFSAGDFPTGDGLIIKVDADGNELWQKTVGTSQEDRINDVANTADGGFVVAGITAGDVGSGYLGNEDGMVLKFDKDGNQIWGKNIGTNSSDLINSIIQTADGGYALGGMTYGSLDTGGLGEFDGMMAKLDANGNKVWAWNVGTNKNEQICTIVQTADGGYAVAGSTDGGNFDNGNIGDSDGFVIKFSPIYTIKFDGNGGAGSVPSQSGLSNTATNLNTNEFTNTGKVFLGWATSLANAQNGIVAFADKQAFTITSDMTLYAIWQAPATTQYTVRFQSNGGSMVKDQIVDPQQKATNPPNPTKTGYAFQGWYIDKGLKQAYDFSTLVTHDVTLYAKWSKTKDSNQAGWPYPDTPSNPETGDPGNGFSSTPLLLLLMGISAAALTGALIGMGFQKRKTQ